MIWIFMECMKKEIIEIFVGVIIFIVIFLFLF